MIVMILGMYYVTLGGVIAATYAGYGDNLLDAVETVFFRTHYVVRGTRYD